MKSKDVVIGMRVVPTNKTVGANQGTRNFRSIVTVSRAIRNGQPYLYVTKWNKHQKCWCLSTEIEGGGDFFNAKDFYEYTGENHEI